MTETLLLVLKLSVVALIFGIGLGSTPADLAYLWRRPRLLARSLVAMYVVVPLVILLLAKVLPMTTAVRTAVLVLAVSAGAPLLPKKLMKLGREGYVFSLVVTSSLVAIVAVPLWVELIAAVFGRDAQVDPLRLAALIAKAFLAPLLLGMAVRRLLRSVDERVSERLLAGAGNRPGRRCRRVAGPARPPDRRGGLAARRRPAVHDADRARDRPPDGRPRSRGAHGARGLVRDPARGGCGAGGVGRTGTEDGRLRARLRGHGGHRLRGVPSLAGVLARGGVLGSLAGSVLRASRVAGGSSSQAARRRRR